jgi:chemotaxis protein CheX
MVNVKFLNPFVDAATEVLKAEVDLEVNRGNLSLQKTALTADDITVLITMVGQVQGVVLYGMSESTALKLIALMLGQDFEEFDNLAQSGIAELGNVITGRATVKLEGVGFQSNISPPTVILGNGVKISTLDFARIVVPLQTGVGEIVVHLALRETDKGSASTDFIDLTVEVPPIV